MLCLNFGLTMSVLFVSDAFKNFQRTIASLAYVNVEIISFTLQRW